MGEALLGSDERARGDASELQLKLLRRQLGYCYSHVPWYRRCLDELQIQPHQLASLSEFQRLPIIAKSDIRADVSQFVSDEFDTQHCHTSFSSGTTGEPFATHFDSWSWYRKRLINKMRARAACGMYPWQRTAIIDVDEPAALARKNRLAGFGRPVVNLKIMSIFEEMGALLAGLQSFRPQNIYGYPSHLLQLATYISQQGIEVSGIGQIFTSSEYLAASARAHIEAALGAPVFDVYGSTEFKEIAWQCPQKGGYHINAAEVLVEIIEHDRPQVAGEIGDIVVTDLRNRAMPLVRFRIGDRGRKISGPCPCGRVHPMMAPVSGRKSDFLSLPDGGQLSGYRLTTAIEKFDALLHYQFVQADAHNLQVNTVWRDAPEPQVVAQLQAEVDQVTGRVFKIDVRVLDQLRVDSRNKHKVIINHTLAG